MENSVSFSWPYVRLMNLDPLHYRHSLCPIFCLLQPSFHLCLLNIIIIIFQPFLLWSSYLSPFLRFTLRILLTRPGSILMLVSGDCKICMYVHSRYLKSKLKTTVHGLARIVETRGEKRKWRIQLVNSLIQIALYSKCHLWSSFYCVLWRVSKFVVCQTLICLVCFVASFKLSFV